MLIASIGTGTSPDANADLHPEEMNIVFNATKLPSALMFAALNEQDFLCRSFGKCLVGDLLDREIGDMIGKKGPVNRKTLHVHAIQRGIDLKGLAGVRPAGHPAGGGPENRFSGAY